MLRPQNRQKDIVTQRSNYGIHKDDLYLTLNEMPLKIALHKAKESFLFGIKFAQFEIKANLDTTPCYYSMISLKVGRKAR
ncbi:MAG: hypothetical protein IPJ31_08785 [Bacteroidetes bacterium]|nr:hypothetical protein [Bacteroidota bacterium]